MTEMCRNQRKSGSDACVKEGLVNLDRYILGEIQKPSEEAVSKTVDGTSSGASPKFI
jgi:hypothetical protein